MLDPSGHFDESTSLQVAFPADDADALELILHFVHLQQHQITDAQTRDLGLLKKVAILGEKYDMIYLLRPSLKSWLAVLQPHFDVTIGLHEALWVSYHCGESNISHDSTFYEALRWLVVRVKPMPRDPTILMLADRPMHDALPSGVYGKYVAMTCRI